MGVELVRKAALSVLFALGLIAVPAVTLVGAPVADRISPYTRPIVTLAGLDQDWRLFAPEPPRSAQRLEVITEWSDGEQTVWTIPTSGPWLGAYTDYRWRKWAENAGSDDVGPALWRAAASYVLAHRPARARAVPVAVRLRRWTAPVPTDGQAWAAVDLYRARVAADRP